MKLLLEKLGLSVEHLKCLDEVFIENIDEYRRIDEKLNSEEFFPVYEQFSEQLYAGGKSAAQSARKLNRQMILGDVVEYIFSGRAYYHAAKSEENLRNFYKLILYSVNQVLLYDVITVNPRLRRQYIEKLEENIDRKILYQKPGDEAIAQRLKESQILIWQDGWKDFDYFVDSILPKTLGMPKELIVFAEFIRLRVGVLIPLLLIQRIFGSRNPIAPPDFLIMKGNKEIYGIEVGYKKELQSREFSIRTSIPTFAVDLKNNMHNRCPKCGANILYCDVVIDNYSAGTLDGVSDTRNGHEKVFCSNCPNFDGGRCPFSNYYGRLSGQDFKGAALESAKPRHYHSACARNGSYPHHRFARNVFENHANEFFAQVPAIDGIENL